MHVYWGGKDLVPKQAMKIQLPNPTARPPSNLLSTWNGRSDTMAALWLQETLGSEH